MLWSGLLALSSNAKWNVLALSTASLHHVPKLASKNLDAIASQKAG